MSTTQDI